MLELVWCSKQGDVSPPLDSITKMRIRMATFTLLNLNLLLGAPGAGVKMHDVVRDHTRSQLGSHQMREQQRRIVSLLLAAVASTGVDPTDASSNLGLCVRRGGAVCGLALRAGARMPAPRFVNLFPAAPARSLCHPSPRSPDTASRRFGNTWLRQWTRRYRRSKTLR